MSDVAGVFVWQRGMKGDATPTKWDVNIWRNPMPETKKSREDKTIETHDLTEDEFRLSLDVLARMFPLKPQPKEPTT